MAKLYELEQNFQNLIEVLENTEDESLKGLIEESLNQIQLETNTKIENIIKYIKNLESNLVAYDTEIKRLQGMKKRDNNTIERLKAYLLNHMEVTKADKLTTSLFKVSVTHSKSVNITDIKAIPRAYIRVTEEVKKADIKAALKEGIKIDGVEIKENKSINIK